MALQFDQTPIKSPATPAAFDSTPSIGVVVSRCSGLLGVLGGVLVPIEDDKVFRAVVRPDAVEVVDMLVSSESTSEHSLHNDAMLQAEALVCQLDGDVAV